MDKKGGRLQSMGVTKSWIPLSMHALRSVIYFGVTFVHGTSYELTFLFFFFLVAGYPVALGPFT